MLLLLRLSIGRQEKHARSNDSGSYNSEDLFRRSPVSIDLIKAEDSSYTRVSNAELFVKKQLKRHSTNCEPMARSETDLPFVSSNHFAPKPSAVHTSALSVYSSPPRLQDMQDSKPRTSTLPAEQSDVR